MQLTLWTYEGPPHVGAMRIAASMEGVHYVLHSPQGDTYADLLFTMIERRDQRPPVTYTTFQARDLGGDTAELVKRHVREAVDRFLVPQMEPRLKARKGFVGVNYSNLLPTQEVAWSHSSGFAKHDAATAK